MHARQRHQPIALICSCKGRKGDTEFIKKKKKKKKVGDKETEGFIVAGERLLSYKDHRAMAELELADFRFKFCARAYV